MSRVSNSHKLPALAILKVPFGLFYMNSVAFAITKLAETFYKTSVSAKFMGS